MNFESFYYVLDVNISSMYDEDMFDQVEDFDLSMWIMIRMH